MSVQLPISIEAVMQIARRAGALTVDMQTEGLHEIRSKSTAADLVTEADLASEALLREELTALDRSIGFWGEESNQPPDTEYFWLVDPIDGTVNYAEGIPWYAVNIALNQRSQTLFGLTLVLPSGELFWAQKDGGAYRIHPNGREERLQVNRVNRLEDALLSTGFPYHGADYADNNTTEFARLLPRSRGIRRMGAAAIDLAYVAAGVFAAHWEGWLNPWDIAPGHLLIEEAGGRVTNYGGAPYTFAFTSTIAGNGQPDLHQSLMEELRIARQNLPDKLFEE
jgi:myo-inositol-1(or 4)-monophosphatase